MSVKPIKLYVVPHSHIDMEWYWTVDDLREMFPELFYNSILKQLEEDPNMTFAQDQAVLIEMMLENGTDAQRTIVKKAVQEGRFEPVGGMYIQPELNEPCGEALVRQIQIGQKWMEENLGRRAECAWHIDSFGQVNQMPQILKQSGYNSYVFMRDVLDADDPESFPTEFYYEGLDGTRMLTHWLKNTYVLCPSGEEKTLLKIANVEVTPKNEAEELQRVFAAFLDENSLQHQTGAALILWGDDLYGQVLPTEQIKDILVEGARRAGLQLDRENIIFATPSQFFADVRSKEGCLSVKNNDFGSPVYRQDLRATFVERIKLKQKNRLAEQALLSLESMSAVAGKCVTDIDEMWKPVLFNQFHDTMAGSCVDEVYIAAAEKYDATLRCVQAQKRQLLGNDSANSFCVYNPTQFVRTDVVIIKVGADVQAMDEAGNVLKSRYDKVAGKLEVLIPDIGPYEARSFQLVSTEAQGNLATVKTMENAYFRLTIQEDTGDLVSIWDKKQQKELLSGAANVIVAMQEENPEMEGALCLTGEEITDEGIPAQNVQYSCSELGMTITIIKPFLGFRLKKQIILNDADSKIQFVTDILDYSGDDYLLLTRFPMDMADAQSIMETPFGIIRGRTGFHCAQKWAALEDNSYYAALLNCGTCGYWAEHNTLSMALLRGHKNYVQYGINGREKGIARFFDGGSHTELAAERGDHQFTYALYCCNTNPADLTAQALMYNTPLEGWLAVKPDTMLSPIRKVSDSFIVTKLALERNGELCLRGYYLGETADQCAITLSKAVRCACRTNLLGEHVCDLQVFDHTVTFPVKPFEIVTLNIQFTKN